MPFSRRTSRNAIGDLSGVGGARVWGGGSGGGGGGAGGGAGGWVGGGDLIPGGGGGGGGGLRGVAAFAPCALCRRCWTAGFTWAPPCSFGFDGTGDRGFAPARPGAPSSATRSAFWSLLRKGLGAPVPPGPPRLGAPGPRFAAGPAPLRVGASAAPNHCTWGSTSLRPAPRASEAPRWSPVRPPPSAPSPLNPLVAAAISPRATRHGPRTPGTAPGAIPPIETTGIARARAAMTRAARLAHMPPRAPAPARARSPAATLRCVYAPALTVDVLAVNIDHATESMCATLSVRARARFVPARSRERLGVPWRGRCCAGKPREPAARVRSRPVWCLAARRFKPATPGGRATAEP